MSVSSGALSEYFVWENKSKVKILADLEKDETQKFLPTKAAQFYFLKCDERQRRNLDKILSEIFNTSFPPVDSELILRSHTAIFCILLSIGRGKYIEHFVRFEELADRNLPLSLASPPRHFPIVANDPKFLIDFCQSQMRYCVPIFDSHIFHQRFESRRLLPITFKERLMTQGIATAQIIGIYGPYNNIIDCKDRSKCPNVNTFILESFPIPEGLAAYTETVNSFRSVKNAEGIIKFHGSFDHGDKSHILLEFADKGTLDDFFRTETPPSRGNEIADFWENLFKLIRGLRAIHSVKKGHFGVCPEKILVLSHGERSPSAWNFKFSDTGTSTGFNRNSVPDARPYAPPESLSGPAEEKLSSSADIWSLGCIFSEAALWVADGYNGILDYKKQRNKDSSIKQNDSFHDGEQVLQSVLDVHVEIENHLRRSDFITKDVLISIVDEMLLDEGRPNADELIKKAGVVVAKARKTMAAVSNATSAGSRARSRSRTRNNTRTSSPNPPPMPSKPNIQEIETISHTSDASQSVETWRSQVSNIPLNSNGTGYELLDSATENFFKNISIERITTPEPETDISATSWFLDSPTIESLATPPTSPQNSVRQTQSQPPDLNAKSDVNYSANIDEQILVNQPVEVNRPSKITNLVESNQQAVENQIPKEPRLQGALQTLPSQESSFEYRVPPPLPRNSFSKKMQSQGTTDHTLTPKFNSSIDSTDESNLRLSSLTTLSCRTWNGLQPRPKTGCEVNREKNSFRSKNNSYGQNRAPSNFSLSPAFNEKNSAFSEPIRNDSIRSTSSSIFTTKSNRTGFGSTIATFKNYNLSSVLSSRCNSMISISPSSDPIKHTASALSPVREPLTYGQFHGNREFLDIDTCRLWKQLNKTTKKKSQVPRLPGAHLLQPLQNRDHVFIVDDSSSMAYHWSNVCRLFEGLSYLVKGMSPGGTDLYFTISCDKRRRKGSHDLCNFLSEKRLQNTQTNIASRVDQLLTAYRLKLSSLKKGAKEIRPASYYLLTNGEWSQESEALLLETLDQTATLLKQVGLKDQILISFIGFATGDGAADRIEALSRLDWSESLRIKWTEWNGNVWEMLRGNINGYYESRDSIIGDQTIIDIKTDHTTNISNDDISVSKSTQVYSSNAPREISGLFELA